jgi:ABC-2 type transport system permease protein
MIAFFSWLLIAKHFIKQALQTRRVIGFFLLALIPAAVAIGARSIIPEIGTRDLFLYWVFLANLHVQALTVWVCLCISPSAVKEEAEEGGMEYLLMRPVPRRRIFLARYAACVAICLLILTAGLASLYLACWGRSEPGLSYQTEMLAKLAFTQAIACAMYCALGTLLALITTRAITWGMAYLFFGEMMTAGVKALIGKFTLAYYLRSLLSLHVFPEIPDLYGIKMVLPIPRQFDAASTSTSLTVLLVATVTALVFSLIQFRRREWAKPPQDA